MSTEAGRLAGKVAIITGAASGIGKATAAEFIRHGAKVIIADIQRQLGEEAAAELGSNASFILCDVTKESDVSDAVDFAISKHGHLDIMFNNAGTSEALPPSIVDFNFTDFDRIMSVNVRGVLAGIKHAARVMVPRQAGCILCTSSVSGILGGVSNHYYSISKFTVAGMIKCIASELCQYGVRVNCISPGVVPTSLTVNGVKKLFPGLSDDQVVEMLHRTGVLKGAKCEASDIAKAALYLASDDSKCVSGHNLVVDGGFTVFKKWPYPTPDQAVE